MRFDEFRSLKILWNTPPEKRSASAAFSSLGRLNVCRGSLNIGKEDTLDDRPYWQASAGNPANGGRADALFPLSPV
jgi:hypothetical protein